jgi:hypothetical protein
VRRDANRRRHASLPELAVVDDLNDLITLSLDPNTGLLTVRITAPPNAAAQQQGRVTVRGLPGSSFEFAAQGSFVAAAGKAIPVPGVGRYDFDAREESADAIWSARIDVIEGYLRLTGTSEAGRYSLLQNGGTLTFTYRRIDNARTFRAVATSLRDMQSRHPKEFDTYVLPLLTRFSDVPFLRPGPAEVYAVFAELPADDVVTRRVLDLLPDLSDDDQSRRDAASRSLTAIGPAGVLAVMRLNEEATGPLTGEQRSRLRAVVDASRRQPRATFDPTAARNDPRFLADCLEDADVAVRAAASRELHRVLGREIDYDINLPPAARHVGAEAVRKTLPRPAAPATTRAAPES